MMYCIDHPIIRLIKSQPREVELFVPEYQGNPYWVAMVVPSGMFTDEEIESLRLADEGSYEEGGGHIIANFLPDHLRPADVEKM